MALSFQSKIKPVAAPAQPGASTVSFASKIKPIEQPKGYFGRVLEDYSKAGESIVESAKTGSQDLFNGDKPVGSRTAAILRTGLNTAGQVAKAATAPIIEAPGVKPIIAKIGEKVGEKIAKPVSTVVESFPGGSAITQIPFIKNLIERGDQEGAKTITDVITKAEELKKKHPQVAQDIDNVISILTLGGGKAVEQPLKEASGSILKSTGAAIEKSGVDALDSQTKSFLEDLIRPSQTKLVKEAQVARTTEKGIGPFKKSVIEPEQYEKDAVAEVAKIPDVKPSNTFQQNYNIIRDHNIAEAQNLEKAITENDFVIPKKEVISRLNSTKEILAKSPVLVGDAEKTADRLLAGAVDFVNKNIGKGTGLLKAKKEFDQWVLTQKPKAFDSAAENAFSIANREVRKVFKDILDENAPNAMVKQSLSRQHALYNAMENIVPKAAQEADTAFKRVLQRAAGVLGTKNKVVQAVAAAAGIGGLGAAATFAPGVALSVIPSYMIYRAGKLIMKPELRIAVGRLLQKSENILNTESRATLKGFLEEYGGGQNKQGGFIKNPLSSSVQIPKELESLAQEAKRFKSAEEFVKAAQDGTIEVPIEKIKSAEPSNARVTVTKPGRKITEPIDVVANQHPNTIKENGEFVVLDGNHRLQQARINGEKTIKAKIDLANDWIDEDGNQHFLDGSASSLEEFYNKVIKGK